MYSHQCDNSGETVTVYKLHERVIYMHQILLLNISMEYKFSNPD